MLNIGDHAHYLGRIPGTDLSRRTYWNKATVLDVSECGRYVKISARPSWGHKRHVFWCEVSKVNETAFRREAVDAGKQPITQQSQNAG